MEETQEQLYSTKPLDVDGNYAGYGAGELAKIKKLAHAYGKETHGQIGCGFALISALQAIEKQVDDYTS